MKKSEAIERAVEFVRKRGSARTPEIAAHLGISTVRISSMLWPACRSGQLVSCLIERPGEPPCNEYRIGAGQPQVGMTPMQTYRLRGADATRSPAPVDTVNLSGIDDERNKSSARHSILAKVETTYGACAKPAEVLATPLQVGRLTVRWALTSDGTFIELGTSHPLEIPSASARSLVDFIRRLDAAEV